MSDSVDPGSVQAVICNEDLGRLRQLLESSPLARSLGIVFTEFEPGRAVARLPAGKELSNFLGYIHTGALFVLAEQVMAAAANSLGYVGLPLNCELQFLKGADPGNGVTATATVVDTQGRIARVAVSLVQEDREVAKVAEMVFLRSGATG